MSLLGPTPLIVGILTLTVVVARLVAGGPTTLRRLVAFSIPATGALLFALDIAFRRATDIHDHLPPTFFVWIGLLVLCLVSRPSGRRLVAVAAVVLSATNAFVQINAHYAYFPTTATLLGGPGPDDLSAARFAAATAPGAITTDRAPHHGRTIPLDIAATKSRLRHRAGSVWLPPAYFDGRRAALPVILMLSGAPGSPAAWPRSGFAVRTADRFAAGHRGFAPILVFTDQNGSSLGDTECVDGPRGKAETFLTADVHSFLRDRLGVDPGPDRTAIVGFSEGGTCALELALRHPDLYGNFVDLAGDAAPNLGPPGQTLRAIYGGDRQEMAAHDPTFLLASHPYPDERAWFFTARGDLRHVAVARRGATELKAAKAGVHLTLLSGGHDWTFAGDAFHRVLPDLANVMQPAGRAQAVIARRP